MDSVSAAQCRFIDAVFFERDDYSRAHFEQLSSPAELHYLLRKHNWDGDNRLLQWLAESPLCSEATALEMFWLAQPQDYQRHAPGKKLKAACDAQIFELIQTLMARYCQGFYARTALHFDPSPHLREAVSIPASLYQPSSGETPYLYWEADEVANLFGEALASALQRANRMDLYNIGALLPVEMLLGHFEALLAHPECERGIAQMLFWRLQRRYPLAPDTLFRADFIRRWQAGVWTESAIAYEPLADGVVAAVRPPQVAWEIPSQMKQAA
ncbi:hypothetical protein CO610_11335 [Lysobacteraceae bacterium NML95-0200]|nr:hypothetical protein CO610_11335 [Xanthomonadaceae bacterium NML95-0200]